MKKIQDLNKQTIDGVQKTADNSTASNKNTAVPELDINEVELQRREAYIEPKTRNLLRELLQNGERYEIIPLYTPGIGYVYQTTEKTMNENTNKDISKGMLENLARLDILQKSFYDTVSACPHCDSTVITLHNRCPSCKSHNIDKTNLTEHIPCGHIDQKNKYINDHCPKCGELLIEGKFRNMGRWYVCQKCNERFENPEFDIICRSCQKTFTIKEAHVTEISKFNLNQNRKREIRQNVASLENIRKVLTDLRFEVQIPGIAIGQKSGTQHHFSLIAKKLVNEKEVIIALDHAVSESDITTSPIILYIYKTSEIKVDVPIFVAVPQLNEEAKKVALGHDIMLIEGSTEDQEIINRIKKEIENRINQKLELNKPKSEQVEKKPESTSFFNKLIGSKKKNTNLTSESNLMLSWQSFLPLGRTALCLALISISLVSVFYAISLLSGIYANNWKVYEPYLINGNLFWVAIAVSTLNILLAIKISKIKPSFNLFSRLSFVVNLHKKPMGYHGKFLFVFQLFTGLIIMYMAFAISFYVGAIPKENTLANMALIIALLSNGLVSVGATLMKSWLS